MKKRPLIYLLYGGSSVDGAGPGEYMGATFSKSDAIEFWKRKILEYGSYATGSVKPVLQDKIDYIHPYSDANVWDEYENNS
jgi:hypothetical protein